MIVTVSGQLKPATEIDLHCFSGGSSANGVQLPSLL